MSADTLLIAASLIGSSAAIVFAIGRWAGKISALLESFKSHIEDHEKRLRVIEGGEA